MKIPPSEALEKVKRYWGDAPVDVFAAARDLHLGPLVDETLPNEVSGAIRRLDDDNWQIVVNGRHAVTRQRFTVAHEIGHFIYHRAKLEACDGTSDTLAFRIAANYYPNKNIGPREEWQANTFAANFLIPNHVLKAAQSLGITDAVELARRFHVSPAAMSIKLGSIAPVGTGYDDEPEAQVDAYGFDRS
ncbi:ImmA/IrrE family metallo-endopeptidase [Phenylobacterium sp.]|uniref:ImmA/IrrE family metallo-endopeptidase n=1 Tax=Phenylobacterium sp. TaxID=1871053 RepID=UPI002FC81F85